MVASRRGRVLGRIAELAPLLAVVYVAVVAVLLAAAPSAGTDEPPEGRSKGSVEDPMAAGRPPGAASPTDRIADSPATLRLPRATIDTARRRDVPRMKFKPVR